MAFESRFHATCCRRLVSPETNATPRGALDAQRHPARVGGRLDRVHRRLERHREVDRQHLEPHRAADDARHVEEILDELRLHARVAVDDLERLGLSGRVERAELEHRDPAEDGVERRAQLVRHRRHELVLGPAERFGRAPGGLLALERGRALALGVALRRRVAKHHHDAEERAVGGLDGGGAVADRDLAPVARHEQGLRRERHAAAGGRDARQRGRGRPARALVERDEDRVDRRADGVGLRPSGQGFRHGVEDRHASFCVGRDHRVADAAERDEEARLVALADDPRRVLAAQRVLEIARRPRPLALRVVALLQPPLEDAARVAQALGEVVELGDARAPAPASARRVPPPAPPRPRRPGRGRCAGGR